MQHEVNGKMLQKGLRTILTERGLWRNGLLKQDALELVRNQPDFKAQKPWLNELVNSAEHEIIFFPKFHCEFNWIERYWGNAKVYARQNCNYTFEGLEQTVPVALDRVSINMMRKFARKSYRYMDAYRLKNGEYLTP